MLSTTGYLPSISRRKARTARSVAASIDRRTGEGATLSANRKNVLWLTLKRRASSAWFAAPAAERLGGFLALMRGEGRGTLHGLPPSLGAGADQLALELGQAPPQDRQHQPAVRRRGVSPCVGERAERDASGG
jgi:hypothetical protein